MAKTSGEIVRFIKPRGDGTDLVWFGLVTWHGERHHIGNDSSWATEEAARAAYAEREDLELAPEPARNWPL